MEGTHYNYIHLCALYIVLYYVTRAGHDFKSLGFSKAKINLKKFSTSILKIIFTWSFDLILEKPCNGF